MFTHPNTTSGNKIRRPLRFVDYLATSMVGAAAASAGIVVALSTGSAMTLGAEPHPAIMPVNVSTPLEPEDHASLRWLYPRGGLGSGTPSPESGASTATTRALNALWRPCASSDPLARRCGLICKGVALPGRPNLGSPKDAPVLCAPGEPVIPWLTPLGRACPVWPILPVAPRGCPPIPGRAG
jgi:hypothetical protein